MLQVKKNPTELFPKSQCKNCHVVKYHSSPSKCEGLFTSQTLRDALSLGKGLQWEGGGGGQIGHVDGLVTRPGSHYARATLL